MNPIIVCGLGNVGYRIAVLLRRLGEPVAIVARGARSERVADVRARGARLVKGDARDVRILQEAGLSEASALITTTDSDAANVEMALDARRVRSDLPVVARLFDQRLAAQLESSFGLRRAVSVSALAAPAFAAAALGEHWIGAFAVPGEGDFVIGRITVPGSAVSSAQALALEHRLFVLTAEGLGATPAPEAPLPPGTRATVLGRRSDWERWNDAVEPGGRGAARSSASLSSERTHARADALAQAWHGTPRALRGALMLVVALIAVSVLVFRATLHVSLVDALMATIAMVTSGEPAGKEAAPAVKLYACVVMLLGSAGMAVLYSLITDMIVTARFRQLLGRQRVPAAGHVIVAGLGNLGFRIVEELRRGGVPVVAVEREGAGEFPTALAATLPVVVGDGRLEETLARAGIEGARALVAAVNDDAVSLGIALEGRRLHPRLRTVARVFDAGFAGKVQAACAVDAALSPSLLAAPTFVASALEPGVLAAFVDADRLVIVLGRAAGERWGGITRAQLRAGQAVLLLLRRGAGKGSYEVVAEGDAPHADDDVVAVVSRPLAGA
jgi:Trk K+ transport system NAD-binding subunit